MHKIEKAANMAAALSSPIPPHLNDSTQQIRLLSVEDDKLYKKISGQLSVFDDSYRQNL